MSFLVFLLYYIFFALLILRLNFFKQGGLPNKLILLLFSLKVLFGIAYMGFYNLPAYHTGSDTFRFFNYSLQETHLLKKSPISFIKDFFSYGYTSAGHIFSGENSYWNDAKSNFIIKLLAVINLFTGSSYLAAIVFFNFLSLIGIVAFIKSFKLVLQTVPSFIQLSIFLFPSFLFWTSGVHKDGIVFSCTGIAFLAFHHLLNHHYRLKYFISFTLSLLVVFILRNYMALATCIGFLMWFILHHTQHKKWVLFGFVSSILFIVILSSFLPSTYNIFYFISKRQQEFLALQGGSNIIQQPLRPAIASFIKYLPNALDMMILRPHLTEGKLLLSIGWWAELLVIIVLLILAVKYPYKQKNNHGLLAALFIAFITLIVAAFTVTFSGAIVRYRGIILPLILIYPIAVIDWKKLFEALSNKLKIKIYN